MHQQHMGCVSCIIVMHFAIEWIKKLIKTAIEMN